MFSWKAVVVWVGALVVTTLLTWQIVSAADSRVGEVPVAVAPTLASSTTSSPTTTSPTTSTAVSPTTDVSGPTTTTPSATTSSSGASTSTSSPPAWSVRTITSPGGTVVVRYRPNEVVLQAATPASGFSVEVDDAGPPKVRVEFEGEDDVRVEAEWNDGQLDVEIDD